MSNNPYQAPREIEDSAPAISQPGWAHGKVGIVCGNYLLILAGLAFVWAIICLVFLDALSLDMTIVFNVWAGIKLKQRNNSWRIATIWLYGFGFLVALLIIAVTLIFGTENLSMRYGARSIQPTPMLSLLVASSLATIAGLPVALLSSKEARLEFAKKTKEAK